MGTHDDTKKNTERFASLQRETSGFASLTKAIDMSHFSSLTKAIDMSHFSSLTKTMDMSHLSSLTKTMDMSHLSSLTKTMDVSHLSSLAKAFYVSHLSSLTKAFDVSHLSSLTNAFDVSHLSSLTKAFDVSHLSSLTNAFDVSRFSSLTNALDVSRFSSLANQFQDLPSLHFAWDHPASFTGQLHNFPDARALRELYNSPLMGSLSRLRDLPFDPALIEQATEIARHAEGAQNFEQGDFSDELAAALREVKSAAADTLDFASLPESVKSSLLWLFIHLVLPVLVGVTVVIADGVYNFKELALERATTPREVHKLARCYNGVEKDVLGNCRVVTGDKLQVRTKPKIKSQSLASLPIGKIVEVLDTSNRSWLLVTVDIDGVPVEGWIAREYTTSFR